MWKYLDKTGSLAVTCVIDLAVHGSVGPVLRSLDFDAPNMRVLAATLAAEVFELSARDGTNCVVGGGPLAQGHAHNDLDGELHGLAPHPSAPRYCCILGALPSSSVSFLQLGLSSFSSSSLLLFLRFDFFFLPTVPRCFAPATPR